jgi:hypothetical protein
MRRIRIWKERDKKITRIACLNTAVAALKDDKTEKKLSVKEITDYAEQLEAWVCRIWWFRDAAGVKTNESNHTEV